MGCAAPRVTHVVQTVEACNQIEVGFLDILGIRLLKAYAIRHSVCGGMPICLLRGRRMEIVSDKMNF